MATQTQRPPAANPANIPDLQRKDAWWVDTLAFFLIFSAFGIWATFRAFQNAFYEAEPYLSPFYSPNIDLYKMTGFQLPNGWQISPALLILPFPLVFRLSCYYYRRFIYRAYLADPAGCAVNEPAFLAKSRFRKYMGERAFPFVAQNFHRYTFYAAVVILVILWYDAIMAFLFHAGPEPDSPRHFGIGIGSLIFLVNACLLTLYTFSCHSWRHLLGGGLDCYSCAPMNKTRYGLWAKVSFLNEKHGRWAMWSLGSVLVTDIYVFLVATNTITDFRFF